MKTLRHRSWAPRYSHFRSQRLGDVTVGMECWPLPLLLGSVGQHACDTVENGFTGCHSALDSYVC